MARYLLSLILVFSLNSYAVVYDDLQGGAGFVRTAAVELKVNGVKGFGEVYFSRQDKKSTMQLFRALMQVKGFVETARAKETAVYIKGNLRSTAKFLEEKNGTVVVSFGTEGMAAKLDSKDVPGVDLQDIPRPFGSKREYCMERLSGKERSVTVVYSFFGPAASCENTYISSLPGKGWKQVMYQKNAEGITLAFEKNNKWCNIFISDKTAVISMYYR